ncbi:glycoside hydrolase [Vibrio chagasii]|nr:glycoside hydrolase [Vibrio chagasii]
MTDKDMKENRQSPTSGLLVPRSCRPSNQQGQEPYKSLLFSPQYRVPLYQTVFHDVK